MTGYIATRSDKGVEVVFEACLANVDRVCKEIKKALPGPVLAGSAFPLQLILREALNNAVLHGCKGNSVKRVKCSAEWDDNKYITVIVEDEGEGFDWKNRMACEPHERACSGRGLAIMGRYGKRVCFNEKGNRVVIEIDPSPGGKKTYGHHAR